MLSHQEGWDLEDYPDHGSGRASTNCQGVTMSEPSVLLPSWAIIEMLGHRRLAGYVSEVTVAGAGFLRVDVPGPDGATVATQLCAPGSLYAITFVTEASARQEAQSCRAAPVTRYDLPALPAPQTSYGESEDDEDEVCF